MRWPIAWTNWPRRTEPVTITARELCTRAMREVNLLDPGEAMSAEDADAVLDSLNEFGHAVELEGIPWGWTDLALDDTVPMPDNHIRGLRLLLAVEICEPFEKAVPADLASKAGRAKRQFIGHYGQNLTMDFDPSLTDFTANRRNDDIPLT